MIGGHMKSSEMFRLSSLIVLWSVSIIGQAKTLQESNWIQATDGILAEAVALVSDRPFPMTDVTQQMQCLLTAIPPNLVHLRQTLPVHNILSEA